MQKALDILLVPINALKSLIELIWSLIQQILDFLLNLPKTLLEGFKSLLEFLFVPSEDILTSNFTTLKDSFNSKFPNSNLEFLEELTTNNYSSNVIDVIPYANNNLTIGSVVIPINTSFITDRFYSLWNNYKDVFQSWISGFSYLLLGIYNYSQILYAIRRSSPVSTTQPSPYKQLSLFD